MFLKYPLKTVSDHSLLNFSITEAEPVSIYFKSFNNCKFCEIKVIHVYIVFNRRFMWFSFVAIGAVATCIIIVSLWEKFQTNPTITGMYELIFIFTQIYMI